MPEPAPERPKKPSGLTPRRVALAALGGAALAIAITFWVGNAAVVRATPCAPQPQAIKAIDAAATGQLAALNVTAADRSHADMALLDKDGRPMTLADFAGKALLVNFWASWCGPCRAEMPALDRLAAAQNDANFMVVSVNTSEPLPEKGRAFFAAGGWSHLVYYADPGFGDAFKQLQVAAVATGLPTTLLIDKKGCEIGVLQGPALWDSPDGGKVIAALKAL